MALVNAKTATLVEAKTKLVTFELVTTGLVQTVKMTTRKNNVDTVVLVMDLAEFKKFYEDILTIRSAAL